MKALVFTIIVLAIFIPAKANLNVIDNFDVYMNPSAIVDELIIKTPADVRKKLSTLEENLAREARRQQERRRFWINTISSYTTNSMWKSNITKIRFARDRECCHQRLRHNVDEAGLTVLALHLESEWNLARRFAVWFNK